MKFPATQFALSVVTLAVAVVPHKPPPAGIVIDAHVVEVQDGDTVHLRPIAPVISLRLKDVWAPELREKGGPESKAELEKLLAGKRVRVFLPAGKRGRLSDMFSFGRVLGYAWNERGVNVNEAMVKSGHATKQKVKR